MQPVFTRLFPRTKVPLSATSAWATSSLLLATAAALLWPQMGAHPLPPAPAPVPVGLVAPHGKTTRAVTLVVTSTGNTDDDNPGDGVCQISSASGAACTLRAAIEEANAKGGGTINFNIPGSGVHTIAPPTNLPDIISPITINGHSQSGASSNTLNVGSNAKILIELSGVNSTDTNSSARGLTLERGSDGSVIRGLVINQFDQAAISIGLNTESGRATVAGCFLGTDATGTQTFSNAQLAGVIISTGNNNIGSTSPADRNVISGFSSRGILVNIRVNATGNQISGNLIGTDTTGTSAIGNGVGSVPGVGIELGGSKNVVQNNVISANGAGGMYLNGTTSIPGGFDTITGNLIGTNAAGTAAIGNGSGFNLNYGIAVFSGGNNTISNNRIAGNLGDGIRLSAGNASNNKITGNSIGRIASNPASFANGGNGVTIASSSFQSGTPTGNVVLSNSIGNNGKLGIDLGDDGVTANDAKDPDAGANNLQNWPVLGSVTTNGSGAPVVSGTLNSLANTSFRLQFFANTTADSSGNGEGEYPLDTLVVQTNSSGNANFAQPLVASIPSGAAFFAATATRLDASNNPVETSEFSNALRAVVGPTSTPAPTATPTPRPTATATPKPTATPRPTATPSPSLSINDISVSEGNSGTKNATFAVTLSGTVNSAVSVKYATSNGTATAGSDYTASSGTLNFGAISTNSKKLRAITQTISVPVRSDTVREDNETFFVTLSGASGATISRSRGMGTIQNDDSAADLSVVQSASASSVTTGTLLTFTVRVTNNGPDNSSGSVLTDTLPGGATFVSSSPSPTSRSGGVLTFNLGALGNGASQTITVQVRAPSSVGTISNGATVAGSGSPDPSSPNNGSSVTVQVTNGAPAYSFLLGPVINVGPYSPSLYRPGAHLVQNITITNTGNAPSGTSLLLVLGGLPSSVTLVNGSGTLEGSPYVTLPGALAVGQSVTVRLEYKLTRSDRPTFTSQIVDDAQAF